MAGAAGGIGKGTPPAVAAAGDAGAKIGAALSKGMGVKSPSTIGIYAGEMLMAGVVKAFGGSVNHAITDVQHSASQVANAVTGTVAAAGTVAGTTYGTNLANGIKSALNITNISSQGLASAASKEADAVLGRMGLLGAAGSGASTTGSASPVVLPSGTATGGGGSGGGGDTHVHCYIDGRDITHTMRVEIKKNNQALTAALGRQKR